MYYILNPAVGTEDTGNTYPTAESYFDYDFKAANSVHNLRSGEFPNFEPDIRFKLASGAKLTDMLSQTAISAHGFLINEKLKNVFEHFNIIPHRYYPAKIEGRNGTFHKYFWMHLVWKEGKNFVDWSSSTFYKKRLSKNLGTVAIHNEEDILAERQKCDIATLINFEKILLKDHGLNLFILNFFSEVYISKDLKEALEKKRLTGIDLTITDKLNPAGLQT